MFFQDIVHPGPRWPSLGFGLPRALLLLIGVQGAAALTLGLVSPYRFDPGMAQVLGMLLSLLIPQFLFVLLVPRVLIMAVVEKSQSPIRDLAASLSDLIRDRERLAGGALKLTLVCFFVGASAYLKELITVVHPFAWDEAFARLDRALHFGIDPFRLTFAVFGSAYATTALNAIYHGWFILIYFVTFLACFAAPDDRRAHAFLIGLVLTFGIGGNVLATVFSSAGPVYYERLGYGADFEPLMTRLRELHEVSPVWSLGVQEALWVGHTADGKLAGISAMPSMHVATSVLMALYAASYARWVGWIVWTFALAIMVGSVHLGWHYAADGYLGALIALFAWRVGLRIAEPAETE